MKHTLSILIALLCQPAWAQIEVPASTQPYQPITATINTGMPEGATFSGGWKSDGGTKYLEVGSDTIHIWAGPGTHTLKYSGYWVLTEDVTFNDGDGNPVTVTSYKGSGLINEDATFDVIGQLPPEPKPIPPDQPPTKPDLTQYFRDWAATVANDTAGLIKDTDQWRTAFERASSLLIGGTDYVAVEGRTEQIEFILAETIGIANQIFTKELRVKLAEALEQIAATVVVDDSGSVAVNANYRPLISILTGLALTPGGVVGTAVSAVTHPGIATLPGIKWVSHAEAERRSRAGEYVVVQLSMTGCGPCRHLERDVFPAMKQPKDFVFLKLKDQGSAWGVHSFPTSVLIAPGWRIRRKQTTPSSVAGVEQMLTKWRNMR